MIEKVRDFKVGTDIHIFFDIFHKNNKLYLLMPDYKNNIVDIDLFSIEFNGKLLKPENKYKTNNAGPAIVYIYDFKTNNDHNTVIARYKNIIKEFELTHIVTNRNKKLCLTTLFKNDYKLINIFYDYYKKQGIDHFYLYYNGELTDDIISHYDKKDITLIQWNFQYLSNNSKSGLKHHAQPVQIHHALYKYGKGNTEYMIFCDLDEYLNSGNKTLLEEINDNPDIDIYKFHNFWSNTLDNKIPDTFPVDFVIKPDTNKINRSERSKCIYRVDKIDILNIHYWVVLKPNTKIKSEHIMYHFYNWSNPSRVINFNEIKFSDWKKNNYNIHSII